MRSPDLGSGYLARGLIAYLGNKRALLPFLRDEFARCAAVLDAEDRPPRFLDPFSGAGGVSRLARAMGFSVAANDRERYAALLLRCRLVMGPRRLEAAFAPEGGAAAAFAALNAFASGTGPAPAAEGVADGAARRRWTAAFEESAAAPPYLARHYAPADTRTADWRTERLFYTAENARFLDRSRTALEALYPADPLEDGGDQAAGDAKAALLDAILYEAATRVNTSGVFKACHRGFGGHGGDALSRIVSPMRLLPPDLVEGPPASVSAADAARFCSAAGPADLVYLDPPYNQHQYGSNYHLLTTIARWDRPPVSGERDGTGFLLDRSGIRPDWTATRSDFCSRRKAGPAFRELLDAVDARFLLVSYSGGGFLSPEEIGDLLSARGELRIEAVPYVAYRGGRQSATRTERTSEFLFVSDASRRPSAASRTAAARELRRRDALGALDRLRKARFRPGDGVGADGRLSLDPAELAAASTERLERLAAELAPRACATNVEAFDLVGALLEKALVGGELREAARLGRDALALLGKTAFRKYAAVYGAREALLRAALGRLGSASLLKRLDALSARAALRGARAPQPMSRSSSSTSAAKVRQAASTGSGPAMSTPATRSDSIG